MAGDAHGFMSHHRRACREFAKHIVLSHHSKESDLLGILGETYAFLALIGHLDATSPVDNLNKASEYDQMLSLLEYLHGFRTSGSLLGCSQDLYMLIPRLAALELGQLPLEQRQFDELETKVLRWSHPTRSLNHSEQIAGSLIQKTLLLLLYSAYRNQMPTEGEFGGKIQPLIHQILTFFAQIEDTPAAHTVIWALLVTGSMMVREDQKQNLSSRLRCHQAQTPLTSRVAEILEWLWDDSDAPIGLLGLQEVTKGHKTHICLG